MCWGVILGWEPGPGGISGGLLITPLVGKVGSGWEWQMDTVTSPYQGLVIQSTLRALQTNNRNPATMWIKRSMSMKNIASSLPLHTEVPPLTCIPAPQNTQTVLPRVTPTSLGSETQSSWSSIWGLINCSGEQKQSPTVAKRASVVHYHHHLHYLPRLSLFHCCPAKQASTIPPAVPKPQQRAQLCSTAQEAVAETILI